jgi:hypothetical protein
VIRVVPGAGCRASGAALVWAALVVLAAVPARAQMPDARAMHGQAIPAGDMTPGTVTVRVVRQALGNNIAGVAVELHGAGDVRTATTGADGRAQFTGVPAGAQVHAIATVEGERLESTAFSVPSAGGIRAILVAGLGLGTAGSAGGGAAAPAAPAPSAGAAGGATGLHFGNNTRLAIEFQDDTIAIFYLLELINPATAPAALPAPLTFDLPEEGTGAAMLDGASPLATLTGRRVTITGPVPAGTTQVPVAFRLERWGARHDLVQAFPLPLDQVAIGVQRLSGLTVESAQAPSVRDATLSGQAFLIANGPTLPAGTPLRVTLGNLPHRSPWPLYGALALAAAVVAIGAWLAMTPAPPTDAVRRQKLEARRARGLAHLAALDADHRAGRIADPAYAERRARLVADLERIYGELDAGGTPPGGGQGLAA